MAIGADLAPGTLVHAYCSGLFPMPVEQRQVGWFWPEERGIFRLGDLKVTKSMRRSAKRYTTTLNQAFDQVIASCGDPDRPHGWIDDQIVEAYTRLHKLGVAHSIEVWDDEGLAGGLYGINVKGLFAGESMFHHRADASKVALMALANLLWGEEVENKQHVLLDTDHSLGMQTDNQLSPHQADNQLSPHKQHVLLDTQWATPHLSSLGAIEVDRPTYAKLLATALEQPTPAAFDTKPASSTKPDPDPVRNERIATND